MSDQVQRDINCIVANWPAPGHIQALTTLRTCSSKHPGTSEGVFSSFNLAAHVNDNDEAVKANRQMLKDRLQLSSEPVWLEQIHSRRVIDADTVSMLVQADASWASKENIVCAVLTADCLPVFFTNQQGSVVAIAHAGWRGLSEGIITATLRTSGIKPEDCLVWLGPAIGPDNFEVGKNVYESFVSKDKNNASAFYKKDDEHWLCDLYQLARIELEQQGVSSIHGGGLCTYADAEKFYSFRRDGETGRMASLIWIK